MTEPATEAPKVAANGHDGAGAIPPQLLLALLQSLVPQERKDGWGNVISGLGVSGKDARIETKYKARKPIDWMTIEALYEQDDIFPLIVDRIPEHATRRWIRIAGAMDASGRPDKDFGRNALEELERVDARHGYFDLWKQHRLHGGSIMIPGADDGQAPDKPLNIEAIRKVTHLSIMNRWEVSLGPRNFDPLSPNYKKPEFYVPAQTGQQIHYTRVIRLPRHMVASDLSTRAIEGWDLPIIERVWEPLRQFGSLFGYAESIFQDLFQGVATIKGLAKMLSSKEGTNDVLSRMQTMSYVRSALNMIILDEGETYERRNQTPTGLNDILLRVMDRLAAAAEMPLSILFGQPPTGLSTDDKSGRTSFYDGVKNKQDRLLRPALNRLLEMLIAAKQGPFKGRAPEKWSIDFLPLEEENEKDESERRRNDAEFEEKQILNGVFTPQEVRGRYLNDESCPYPLDATIQADETLDTAADDAAAAAIGLKQPQTDAQQTPPQKSPPQNDKNAVAGARGKGSADGPGENAAAQ